MGTALSKLKGILATHSATGAGHEGNFPVEAGVGMAGGADIPQIPIDLRNLLAGDSVRGAGRLVKLEHSSLDVGCEV